MTTADLSLIVRAMTQLQEARDDLLAATHVETGSAHQFIADAMDEMREAARLLGGVSVAGGERQMEGEIGG